MSVNLSSVIFENYLKCSIQFKAMKVYNFKLYLEGLHFLFA